MYWYETPSDPASPVISTRVRFARNIKKIPFPALLSPQKKKEVASLVKNALSDEKVLFCDFDKASPTEKNTYVETHLASESLAASRGAALILSDSGDVSVMVNEEDHIRLQCIKSGFDADGAFEKAAAWTKKIEERLPVAYLDRLGYLTRCPTNLGAAMRISAMVHLPALSKTGQMNSLARTLGDAGFTVRGIFGEGSGTGGNICQISNQSSRDKPEEQIKEEFKKMADAVMKKEKEARDHIFSNNADDAKDAVCRALGILTFARKMTYSEFLSLYSEVRFGIEAGIPETAGIKGLDRLLTELEPYPMMLSDMTLSDPALRDRRRSEILREKLKGVRK